MPFVTSFKRKVRASLEVSAEQIKDTKESALCEMIQEMLTMAQVLQLCDQEQMEKAQALYASKFTIEELLDNLPSKYIKDAEQLPWKELI